jgi:O-antigen ligase
MSTIDPWEQRERERERWRTKSARSAGSSTVLVPRFSSRVLWICILVALHLIGDIPSVSQTLRTATLCLGFVGWVTFLGLYWPAAGRNRTGMTPFIVAVLCLLAWVTYRSVGTGFPMQAFGGWLQWMSVAAALTAGLFCAGTRSERMMILAGVGGIAVFVAGIDLSRYGVSGDTLRGTSFHASSLSLFGTHEAVGTLLGFLIPVAAAFAVHRGTTGLQKSLALGATLVVALAWAFARCRAGWLGGITGCMVVGILSAVSSRRHGVSNEQPLLQRIIGSVWLWLIAGGGIVLASSGLWSSLTSRAGGFVSWWELGSVAARTSLWATAYRMISEHPLTGWGSAGFLTNQGVYSHHGEAPWQVKMTGGTLANNAHSFPLQFTVDFGIPAFFLLLLFVAWVWGRALMRAAQLHPDGTVMSRAACGLIAAVAVSSLASPAYELTSVLIWVAVLGGTLLGTDDSQEARGKSELAMGMIFLLMAVPVAAIFPLLRPKLASHTFSLAIIKHPKGIGDIAAVKAGSTSAGKIDSSFPGTEFLVPELAVIDKKGHVIRVIAVPDTAVSWTYNRRSNTQADAILEVTIPPVDIEPGESLELGVSGTLSYVDGERRTAGVAIPVVTPSYP